MLCRFLIPLTVVGTVRMRSAPTIMWSTVECTHVVGKYDCGPVSCWINKKKKIQASRARTHAHTHLRSYLYLGICFCAILHIRCRRASVFAWVRKTLRLPLLLKMNIDTVNTLYCLVYTQWLYRRWVWQAVQSSLAHVVVGNVACQVGRWEGKCHAKSRIIALPSNRRSFVNLCRLITHG